MPGNNPSGQNGKLTPEAIEAVKRAMLAGAYFKDACAHAGVSPATGYRWLQEGARDEPPLREAHHDDAAHAKLVMRWELAREFRETMEKAEADAKIVALGRIRKAGQEGTWQADAWYLERRYPHEYGRRVHEHSGPEGGPIVVQDARERLTGMLDRLAGIDADVASPA